MVWGGTCLLRGGLLVFDATGDRCAGGVYGIRTARIYGGRLLQAWVRESCTRISSTCEMIRRISRPESSAVKLMSEEAAAMTVLASAGRG